MIYTLVLATKHDYKLNLHKKKFRSISPKDVYIKSNMLHACAARDMSTTAVDRTVPSYMISTVSCIPRASTRGQCIADSLLHHYSYFEYPRREHSRRKF